MLARFPHAQQTSLHPAPSRVEGGLLGVGISLGHLEPRALPWAIIQRPFRPQGYLQFLWVHFCLGIKYRGAKIDRFRKAGTPYEGFEIGTQNPPVSRLFLPGSSFFSISKASFLKIKASFIRIKPSSM